MTWFSDIIFIEIVAKSEILELDSMALSIAAVPSSSEQNRKLFLGGLVYTTTDAKLK